MKLKANTAPAASAAPRLRLAALSALLLGIVGVADAAPPAPVALIAVAGDGEARLSWEPVPGARSYTVKRRAGMRKDDDESDYRIVARNLGSTSYVDSALKNGTAYYYYVVAESADGSSPLSNRAKAAPVAPFPEGAAKWPLSRSGAEDADGVAFQYAPRRIGRSYDFHAGIDIPAAVGTPVHPVMDGVVTEIVEWDGRHGPGNKVLVRHGDQKWTAYLHLDSFAPGLEVGQEVKGGETVLGHVGRTGAFSEHLHLTYMTGLTSESNNETRSRNPLEILPHGEPEGIGAAFASGGSAVALELPAHRMTVRWIILQGEGQTRVLDYYQVVEQGSRARDRQSQSGLHLDAGGLRSPFDARASFRLTVRPDPAGDFRIERVQLKDFNGRTLLDAAAPRS